MSDTPDTPDTIPVLWSCGCFAGSPTWGGEDAPQCVSQWETDEEREDWESGVCSSQCPGCGARVTQRDGNAVTILQ